MSYQCDPCDCPEQHYRGTETFKKAMITLLCGVRNAITGGGPTSFSPEQAALGTVPGVTPIRLMGRNGAISSSIETIWPIGAEYPDPLAANTAMEAVSSSGSDTAAGTGAQTIQVTGTTLAGVIQTEDVIMNGGTAVPLVNTYAAINSVEVLTTGTGNVNAGNISIQTAGGGQVWKRINTSTGLQGRDLDYVYRVPANNKLLIYDFSFGSDDVVDSAFASIRKWIGVGASHNKVVVWGQHYASVPISGVPRNQYIPFPLPLIIDAGVMIEAAAYTPGNAGAVTVYSNAVLIDTTFHALGT